MTGQESKTPEMSPAETSPTLKEFLETCPPDVEMVVTKRAVGPYSNMSGGSFYRLSAPELDLHCEFCDGTRAFKATKEVGCALEKKVSCLKN